MKEKKVQQKKLLKLRNQYTGDIVFTENYDTPSVTDGTTFIPVYSENNPSRIYLVNKQAFSIVHDK
jgi:hypothetical protein